MTIEIDGGEQSGSGTIVRTSVALAALSGRPLHLTRARARREKPGLRAQHLAAVRACAELCRGQTKGLGIGATEFTFLPGSTIRGGSYEWDIGTAGSATMLALGVLPVVCFAEAPVVARITGGVFQDFAPSPHHLQHVLAPLLARMGGSFALKILRAGYVPGGAGIIEIEVEPIRGGLRALELHDPGVPGEVAGVAFASHLAERRVAQRMARVCEQRLVAAGLTARIARVEDSGAAQAGASLAAWTESSTGCLFGADRAGARRRSSEAIGRFVARRLLQDLESGATTDRHVADQLVPFCALASGTTRYRAPLATEHLVTNLWLAERFGARTRLDGQAVEIEGLGLGR
jgi:RNA 3'-terminal phosphate cyclase (ATP)